MSNWVRFEDLLGQLEESKTDIEIVGVFLSHGSIAVSSDRFGVCNCQPLWYGEVPSPCELCGRKRGNYVSVPGTSDDRNYLVFEICQSGEELPVAALCIAELEYADHRVLRRGNTQKFDELKSKKLSQFKDCELVPLGVLEDSPRSFFHDGFGQLPLHVSVSIDSARGRKKVFGVRGKGAGSDIPNSVFEGLLVAEEDWLQANKVVGESAPSSWQAVRPIEPNTPYWFDLITENLLIQRHCESNQRLSHDRRSYFRSKATSLALLGAFRQDSMCRRLFWEHYSDISVREVNTLLSEFVFDGEPYLGGSSEDWTCDGCAGDLIDAPGALCSRCLEDGAKGSKFQAFLENSKHAGLNFQSEGFFFVNNPVLGFFGNSPAASCSRSHGYVKSWGDSCDNCDQSGHRFPIGISQGPGIIQSIYGNEKVKALGLVALVEPQEQIRKAVQAVLDSALMPAGIGDLSSSLPMIQLARFPDFESTGELLAGVGAVNFADFGKPYLPIDLKPETHQVYGLFIPKAAAHKLLIESSGSGAEGLERMSRFWNGQGVFDEPQVQIGYLVINQEYESLVVNPKRFIDTRALALQFLLSPEETGDLAIDRDTWKSNALFRLARYNHRGSAELAVQAKSWLLSAGLDGLAKFHFPVLDNSNPEMFKQEEL